MKTVVITIREFSRRAAALLLAVMMTATTAWAQAVGQEGDWRYSYDSGTNILTITSYEGTDANVTTPTTLGGHVPTAIGEECFRLNNPKTYMTSVTVSEGVTTIGDAAFVYCSHLASVSLPNSLVSIGLNAFMYCSALTSINIPNSVTSIGHRAFSDCSELVTITIPSSVTEIGDNVFYGSGLTDLYYTGTKTQWNNVSVDTYTFEGFSATVHWQCTATFDMQGHGTAPAAQTVYSSVANALTAPTAPTATGYEFGGWYRNAACTQAFDFTAALNDNVTVYAKWTALANTITFDLGDRGSAISKQTVYSGNTVTEPAVQFDGAYGIEGWYTDAGRTVAYDFTTVVDHSFTLYANWATAGTATITANAGGTATLTNDKGQTFNDGKVMPGTYTLTVTPASGYSFSGTYTLTNRTSHISDMDNDIVGGATKTYTLDLTEKDATINVIFSSDPILTITKRADDENVLSEVTYIVVNNQTPTPTYDNGSTIPVVTGGAVASEFGIRLTVDLGTLSGYGFTATITDNGNGNTMYKNSNDGTSFLIQPYGSIDIDLHVYQPQTIALLDDGSNINNIIALNGDVANVTLKRAYPAGKKQTVCLPFKPTELLNQGTVWEFTGIENGKAVMTERTQINDGALKANTPYIFAADADIDAATGIYFGTVGIDYGTDPKTTKQKAGFTFHGTYGQKHWLATDDKVENGTIYGFMERDNDGQQVGQFVKARRETYLRPFSCWLEYDGDLTDTDPTSQAPMRSNGREDSIHLPDLIEIVWVKADGIVTSAGAIDLSTGQIYDNDSWYTIDGRKLPARPTDKGLYINNGKKVMINAE